MCGRVALAHDADELDYLLVDQYFPIQNAAADDNFEDDDIEGGRESAEQNASRAVEEEEEAALRSVEGADDAVRSSAAQGISKGATPKRLLIWSKEAKEKHRPRYNVGPASLTRF